MLSLLLVDSAILDLALADVQQFAEISNLSKVDLALCLCGFEGLSFRGNFCVNESESSGVGEISM